MSQGLQHRKLRNTIQEEEMKLLLEIERKGKLKTRNLPKITMLDAQEP